MANTKNSQAAKIRKQLIAWLQNDELTETVDDAKFPGIRGIRAVKLREMLAPLGYAPAAIMGAVAAAPSIDYRIQKATLKPREVYYYFDASVPAKPAPTTTPAPGRPVRPNGLASTPAFAALQAANAQVGSALDDLLTTAQRTAPLSDLDAAFLTDLAAQLAKQTELLQNYAIQDRIAQLRRPGRR